MTVAHDHATDQQDEVGEPMTRRVEKVDRVEPTPERERRGELVQVEVKLFDEIHKARLDLRASLLDRYWRDQLLLGDTMDLDTAAARREAGQRLQLLYEETGLRRRLTVYGSRAHGYGEMTDVEEAAFEAYKGVMRKLTAASPECASAVINLCIHEIDPVNHTQLRRGLDILVRHWGL